MVDTSMGTAPKTQSQYTPIYKKKTLNKNQIASINNSPFSRKVLIDLMAISDIILMIISAIISKYLYIDLYLNFNDNTYMYIWPGIGTSVAFYIIQKHKGNYNKDRTYDFGLLKGNYASTIIFSFGLMFIVLFLAKISSTYSRIWFLCWLVLFFGLLLASRVLWSLWIRRMAARGLLQRRVAAIGLGKPLRRVINAFDKTDSGYRLVAVCDLEQQIFAHNDKEKLKKQVLAIRDLIDQGQQDDLDQVIIALPATGHNLLNSIVKELRLLPIDIQILPDLGNPNLSFIGIETVRDLRVINIETKPISDWGVHLKLAADYILGFIALILFLPVMALIAIAIKLDSPGPVLFRQKRHGYNHHIIEVLKFRTMTVCEDGSHIKQATKNDKRITRIGYILRRTSLDELPQLFNVLRGEMSLVGPRPHALAHNSYYGELLENYANRHRVKPGITGWAQIHGFRGETQNPTMMEKRITYDLEYISQWSIWLDLRILLLTPIFGFVNRKAY